MALKRLQFEFSREASAKPRDSLLATAIFEIQHGENVSKLSLTW